MTTKTASPAKPATRTPKAPAVKAPAVKAPAKPKAPARKQTGSEIVKALEAVWAEVVKRHPELPDVVMITGSGLDLMGAKWAHFWRERWTDRADKSTRPEMFIAGERLACGAELTLQSILHEAAHALAFVREENDTSRQNRYHNKTFVKMAEELGLEYAHEGPDTSIGFSAVTLSAEGKAAYAKVIEKLDAAIKIHLPGFEDLGSNASGGSGGDGTHRITGIKRTKSAGQGPSRNNGKYVCECETPRILRMAKKTFEVAGITCGACGSEFTESE